MIRILIALAVVCLGGPLFGQKSKSEPDPFEALLKTLETSRVEFEKPFDGTTLRSLKVLLEKKYAIKIVVREDLFKLAGGKGDFILDRKFKLDSNLSGITLHSFLLVMLMDIDATMLIRKGYIEITTWQARSLRFDDPLAEKFRKGEIPLPDSIRDAPLVCAVIRDQPVQHALEKLALHTVYTVIVTAQAADDAKTQVSARLMNVPFPTALDVLALNAGLKVVRRDNTFIVTTVEHAGTLKAKAVKPVKK